MGYLIAFAAAALAFSGVPLPASFVVLVLGAVASSSSLHLPLVVLSASAGVVAGDTLWFALGRARGESLLRLYCRATLGSSACTARTRRLFDRWGARSLAVAPFVPGLSTFAAPFAGMNRVALTTFLAWEAIGATAWASLWATLGDLVGLELVYFWGPRVAQIQSWLVGALVAIAVMVTVHKIVRRVRLGAAQPRELAATGRD